MARLIAFLAAASCVPLFFTRWPPLVDYFPNLARVFILNDLLTVGRFADRYFLAPSLVPNLGMDAIMLPMLAGGLGIGVAGRLYVALVVVVSGLAVVALNRALFGRVSPLALAGFVFAYG